MLGLKHAGLVFSSDSRHLAYAVQRGATQIIVRDGMALPAYEAVGRPSFSGDSAHLAYAALKAPGEQPWVMVVDEQESPEYDAVGKDECFSADGRHFVFWAANRRTARTVPGTNAKDRKLEADWHLILDGVSSSPACRYVLGDVRRFSPDSAYVIASGRLGGQAVNAAATALPESEVPGVGEHLVQGGETILFVNGIPFVERWEGKSTGFTCSSWFFIDSNRIRTIVCTDGQIWQREVDLSGLGVKKLDPSNKDFVPAKATPQTPPTAAAESKPPAQASRSKVSTAGPELSLPPSPTVGSDSPNPPTAPPSRLNKQILASQSCTTSRSSTGADARTKRGRICDSMQAMEPGDTLRNSAVPALAGRSFTVSLTAKPEGPGGVLVAHGGTSRGYAIYLTADSVCFTVHDIRKLVTIKSPKIPQNEFKVQASLAASGTVSLIIDGVKVASGNMNGTLTKKPAESFCVGFDDGTHVIRYPAGDHFRGTIKDLKIATGVSR